VISGVQSRAQCTSGEICVHQLEHTGIKVSLVAIYSKLPVARYPNFVSL